MMKTVYIYFSFPWHRHNLNVTLSIEARHNPGKIIIRKEGDDIHYEYDTELRMWKEKQNIALSFVSNYKMLWKGV